MWLKMLKNGGLFFYIYNYVSVSYVQPQFF